MYYNAVALEALAILLLLVPSPWSGRHHFHSPLSHRLPFFYPPPLHSFPPHTYSPSSTLTIRSIIAYRLVVIVTAATPLHYTLLVYIFYPVAIYCCLTQLIRLELLFSFLCVCIIRIAYNKIDTNAKLDWSLFTSGSTVAVIAIVVGGCWCCCWFYDILLQLLSECPFLFFLYRKCGE